MSDVERDDRRDERAMSYDRDGSRGAVAERSDRRDDYERSAPRDNGGYHREPRYDAGPGPPRRPPHAPTPDPSKVLGVFGLSMDTTERDLEAEFSRMGAVEKVIIVYDKQTQRSRGFGFVTMENIEDATRSISDLNGVELQGRRLRVDYSATTRPHDPTPGAYRGFKREDSYRSAPPPPPREYNDKWATGGRYAAAAPVRDDRWGATSNSSRRDDRYGGDRHSREDRYSGRDSYSRGGDYDRRDDRSSRDAPRESRVRSRSPPPRRDDRDRSPPRRSRDDYPVAAEAPVADDRY